MKMQWWQVINQKTCNRNFNNNFYMHINNFIIYSGSNTSDLIVSLSLFIRMTPKIYNAQSRLLDSIAMSSWPKRHYENIKMSERLKDEICYKKRNLYLMEIIFDSVSFNYPDHNTILKNINLKIKK